MSLRSTSVGEVLSAYWPILVCSFLVSVVATPVCRWFALRHRIVDRPDDFLKPHKRPIPYLGGVAIFLGWAGGLLLAMMLFQGNVVTEDGTSPGPMLDLRLLIVMLIAGLGIMFLGLFDDLRVASPRVKLAGTVLIGLLLIGFGLGDDTIVVLLRSVRIDPGEWSRPLVLIYSAPISLLIIIGACNATNLIDGVDGLCTGVLGIISAGFFVLAVYLHLWGHWDPPNVHRVTLALAMMGAALGFLPYNRSPATIFMGDAGSMLLGLNVAMMILLFGESRAYLRWVLGAIMMFGLPIADMVLAIVRRWRNEWPVMKGDRSHFYDQLLDSGWPLRRVVAVSYALAGLFAVAGLLPIVLRTRYVIPIYVLIVVAGWVLVTRFRMVRLVRPNDIAEASANQVSDSPGHGSVERSRSSSESASGGVTPQA